MIVPLYGFLEGDPMGVVILAHDSDLIAKVSELLQQAARVRVPHRDHMLLRHGERVLDPTMTVTRAGLTALERVDLVSDPRAER